MTTRPRTPRPLGTLFLSSLLAVVGLHLPLAGPGGPAVTAAHAHPSDLAEVAEKARQSVVNISSTKAVKSGRGGQEALPDDPMFRRFFQLPPGMDIPQERRARSLGSGVIVDAAGIVLTNNHVIDGADEIKVTLDDNREFDAELVGADPQSDVAVLRIKGDPKGLRAVPFGDSNTLRLADTVLAIGNPFGVGQTVTMGIVSAKGRANLGIADYEDFIQTDAAINPGNSGGALLNTRGELVGINTAIVSRSGGFQGVGFAIPSNMARGIMGSLMSGGKVDRGWLGVSIQGLDRDLADAMGIEQAHGVLVADVVAEGPAARAGIRRGDVILEIGGREVKSTGELKTLIGSHSSGKPIAVTVLRDRARRTIDVELGAVPSEATAEAPARAPSAGLLGGVAVADLGPDVKRRFQLPDKADEGAVVVEVDPRSPAARAGVAPGDVILQVDKDPVGNAADFRALAGKARGASVLLLVSRASGTIFVPVKK